MDDPPEFIRNSCLFRVQSADFCGFLLEILWENSPSISFVISKIFLLTNLAFISTKSFVSLIFNFIILQFCKLFRI